MTRTLGSIAGIILAGGLAAGCGPTLSTQMRIETLRAPDNPGTLAKDGLIVEIPELKELPEQMLVNVARCGPGGPLTEPVTGAPAMTNVVALPLGAELFKVKIANQTDHVLRMQGAVIRLFDPAENQLEPQSKEEIAAAAMRTLPSRGVCGHELAKIQAALTGVRFIGPNTELLPGTTITGYLVFMPPKADLAGVWKLSLYELPVKVDAAGNAVTKTRFDFAYLRKRYEDSYSQELMGDRKLVSTREMP